MRHFLLLAATLLTAAAPAFAQGRTTFATDRHDFARIDEGPVATTAFTFTNTGDRPVRLVEVRPSCGCTTPEYPTGAVAPGETAEIVVAYASDGRPGPFEKHVTVVTDADETTTLTIVGDVIPGFTRGGAAQGSLVFERDVFVVDTGAGEAVQQAFRFQNQGEAPVRITAVRTSAGDAVQVVFPDRPIFARDVAGILVTVENPAAISRADGSFDIAITMETTDAAQPVKSLRLRGVAGAGG